ncbi:MAG: regulatory iron-sulfur-containing complex subunit RicT [Bacteroidota bacterium]
MNNCNTCTLNDETASDGCRSGGCLTGGCNKLNVFDWLSDMDIPVGDRFDVVEVRFKNGRKAFYRNKTNLELNTGDSVVIDVPNGHHIGYISLQGELVRLQMRKKNVEDDDSIRQIYRIASSNDIEKYEKVKNREMSTLYRTREIIQQMDLSMKLTDVEYQADNTKATFFYSADERVDFRELIKVLASEFKIRVEMRQISLRQEAGRMGGIGSCGREICCSTWLTDFKTVTTSSARYQNLSLNPAKLSGQCGRLKCCLNYELDTYMEALEDIPKVSKPLQTKKGDAHLQKTDIFRKVMWFGYTGENMWHPITTERVHNILNLNEKGILPDTLQVDKDIDKLEHDQAVSSDLDRLDRKYNSKGKKKKKKKSRKRRRKSPNSNKSNQA